MIIQKNFIWKKILNNYFISYCLFRLTSVKRLPRPWPSWREWLTRQNCGAWWRTWGSRNPIAARRMRRRHWRRWPWGWTSRTGRIASLTGSGTGWKTSRVQPCMTWRMIWWWVISIPAANWCYVDWDNGLIFS